MIEVQNLVKRFDDFTALSGISCTIPEGSIFGLVGSNGAGKSTFLRILTGVYKADGGSVAIDGRSVFENPPVKEQLVLVPDELYFLPQANLSKMAGLYAAVYPRFDYTRFRKLTALFGLDPKKSVNTFSKGMRRQATTLLALSAMPKYLFFDETFDGLDPVMRNLVKNIIYSDVCERGMTAVITSHSLRELEDTCDQLALLHRGGLVLQSDVVHLKTSLLKIQIAFDGEYGKEKFAGLDMLSFTKAGRVANLIVRGEKETVLPRLEAMSPLLLELLPLTLEEVFVYEMDALGYAFQDIAL